MGSVLHITLYKLHHSRIAALTGAPCRRFTHTDTRMSLMIAGMGKSGGGNSLWCPKEHYIRSLYQFSCFSIFWNRNMFVMFF